MPSLNWAGKDKVLNHHLDVPVRVLERTWGFGDGDGGASPPGEPPRLGGDASPHPDGDQNMIIHGDNLEALKALLPRFEGKVDCIYIDPPYNTGNEGWVYNDNVNDPQIRKWLGEVVGKEGEDFSRHDKWLCMMYPRLRLLHKLLAPHGAIFISIDDNEQANLRSVCDEIFGQSCFVANIAWQRNYSTRNDSKGVVAEVEHILAYSKSPGWQPNKLSRTPEMDKKYKNPDNDPKGVWRSDNAYAPNAATHQGMVYAIQHPFSGKLLYPTVSSCWRYEQDIMLSHMCGWAEYELRDIGDDAKRGEICGVSASDVRKGVKAIVLAKPLEESRKRAEEVLASGPWPRFFFSKNGQGGIARKTYLERVGGIPPTNLWQHNEVGHTDEAKKELMAIFDGKSPFDTPKPTRLLERILRIAAGPDALVLDSFAGSGTTAHAVLKMNAEDGGNRRFILVEMMEYAESITAERVKRVIAGYGEGAKAVAGTGSSFGFYELGPALLEGDGLNEEVPEEKLREYIWWTETRTEYVQARAGGPCPRERYLLGVHDGTAYYFCHERGRTVALDRTLLRSIRAKAESFVVYADVCRLPEETLRRGRITFKKIPRDIARP